MIGEAHLISQHALGKPVVGLQRAKCRCALDGTSRAVTSHAPWLRAALSRASARICAEVLSAL